ncbi:hypothetical protein ABI59_07965 [Acidobacteria bacterium Mor1]|nr:hypothetical protein ABI59_07965 [Acidobacteria bacterium Mor1]
MLCALLLCVGLAATPAFATCGNDVIDPGEVCDGADLGGLDCTDFDCAGGTLMCKADCSDYDTDGCGRCSGGATFVLPDDTWFIGRAGMIVERNGDALTLHWDVCEPAGLDAFAIYEGDLHNFGTHLPRTCSAGVDDTSPLRTYTLTFTPLSGDRYFLIVPQREGNDGGYGPGPRAQTSSMPCGPRRSAPCF